MDGVVWYLSRSVYFSLKLSILIDAVCCFFFNVICCFFSLQTFERALMMLDHIYPHETHKIGVIYVAEGQVA